MDVKLHLVAPIKNLEEVCDGIQHTVEKSIMAKEKISRGNASQFYVAGELCRRGYSAVVTLGNTPNTDVLCSNVEAAIPMDSLE